MAAKTKLILLEDNISLSENIRDILTIKGYEVSNIIDEAESAFDTIEENHPDLLLVDIKLKGKKSGIDLAEKIRESLNIPIVFLTSSSGKDIVKKVKHIRPDGFITKPFTTETLITTIELAIQHFKTSREDASNIQTSKEGYRDELFIRENGWLKKIIISEIDWIKAEGAYTHVFVNGRQYTLRNTAKEVLQKLPEQHFVRIHKSYIINTQKIDALSANSVKIESTEIPIGRNYYQLLLKNINKLSN